jgi:UDP-N-acetylmuramate dehydrogenase
MSPVAASTAALPPSALPPVRGQLVAEAAIGRHTWFGVGGAADMLFEPADRDDLAGFLAALPQTVPVTVIGGGSNLLVRDGGISGVTIRLGRGFQVIAANGEEIDAGAAAPHLSVARFAAKKGVAGLEFLSGIPGTLGGGVRMNAGAYGRELKDLLVAATAIDRFGRERVVNAEAMGFGYRHCGVDPGWIFVATRLRGWAGDPEAITQKMAEIRATRGATQPIRTRTSGSIFKNPPGYSAWQLIDAAGCRGLRRGGAMVSAKHANFLINTGNATAADLEGLGDEVRRRVYERSGVNMEWEICRIGRPAEDCGPIAAEVR